MFHRIYTVTIVLSLLCITTGTPSENELKAMNPNSAETKLSQHTALPLNYLFHSDTPKTAIDLLSKLLLYNPNNRLKAINVCAHPLFKDLINPDTNKSNLIPDEMFQKYTEYEKILADLDNIAKISRREIPDVISEYTLGFFFVYYLLFYRNIILEYLLDPLYTVAAVFGAIGCGVQYKYKDGASIMGFILSCMLGCVFFTVYSISSYIQTYYTVPVLFVASYFFVKHKSIRTFSWIFDLAKWDYLWFTLFSFVVFTCWYFFYFEIFHFYYVLHYVILRYALFGVGAFLSPNVLEILASFLLSRTGMAYMNGYDLE